MQASAAASNHLRATPDLIAPSLARSGAAGSQYSLNNGIGINSNLLSGSKLSSSGLNIHLLQQQLQQQQSQSTLTVSNNIIAHSVNPSLQELQTICGSNAAAAGIGVANINGSSAGLGGIVASGNRVETHLLNSIHQLPHIATNSVTSVGQLPLQINVANNVNPEQLKSLLPAYRQAPDYNTAVQIKYGGPVVQVGDHASSEALYENQRKVSVDVRNFCEASQLFKFIIDVVYVCIVRIKYSEVKVFFSFVFYEARGANLSE